MRGFGICVAVLLGATAALLAACSAPASPAHSPAPAIPAPASAPPPSPVAANSPVPSPAAAMPSPTPAQPRSPVVASSPSPSPASGATAGPASISPVAQSLAGTAWSLASLEDRTLLPGTSVTLQFRADAVNGAAGCNAYRGDYLAQPDGALTVSQVTLTERFCSAPEGVMEQERAYVNAIGRCTAYRLAGDHLELLDARGHLLLGFVPQP